MANSNTIVPFPKFPGADENVAGKPIPMLPAQNWYGGDEWVGTADDLIASGLVTRDQLPGEPGNNKVSATYYKGPLVRKSSHHPHDEHYLSITRYGKHRFIVRKGVSIEEKKRRKTKKILLEKSPNINFSSLAPALFYIGEKVVLDGACVELVDIRYEGCVRSYSYKVEPNLDEKYNWFAEELLCKPSKKSAVIVSLPSAALDRVQQTRGPGRLPKTIASFWDAQRKRWRRDEELKNLREKFRSLNISVEIKKDVISARENELIELKKQIQELIK